MIHVEYLYHYKITEFVKPVATTNQKTGVNPFNKRVVVATWFHYRDVVRINADELTSEELAFVNNHVDEQKKLVTNSVFAH